MDATSRLTQEWLLKRERGKPSLLQRLHASWAELGPRATTDCRIVETFRDAKGPVAGVRKEWAGHLGVDEIELTDFLECLQIRHGQSESEWKEKVDDAAVGARTRTGSDAIAIGLQQVRDWVEAPRSAGGGPETIQSGVFDRLDRPDRRRHPGQPPKVHRSGGRTSACHGRSRGREKNVQSLRNRGHRGRGAMRLPLWFTVGNAFSSTAGFTVCAQARDGLWTSDAHPGDRRDLEVRIPEEIVSEHEPSEIFLFLAMPHACALLLGNAWDRMPATTVFWDMGRPGSYEPALRVN